jgi:Flp pilus assembly protein TadD
MQSLEAPDIHYYRAAVGWLELGVPAEARAELDLIPRALQQHPDVLEVRWLIASSEQRWDDALQYARSLLHAAPERSSGWLHQAYALRRAPKGNLQQAWEALLPAFTKFPTEPTIAYNLSCYACQMENLDGARAWLKRAAALGRKDEIKSMALTDPDLRPLWAEIRRM